ncbi:hypothetical protein GOL95_10115 [Sinorhizobium medicae]|nr:hypothetical protein [Sinorhizobium medicae]
MTEHKHFKAGDPIPEWLLWQQPTDPKSVKGALTFSRDVYVVELSSAYWILPVDGKEGSFLHIRNSRHCALLAGSKPVLMPDSIFGVGDRLTDLGSKKVC